MQFAHAFPDYSYMFHWKENQLGSSLAVLQYTCLNFDIPRRKG